MRFIDLHQDLAYHSNIEDVREKSRQSSIRTLARMGDVTVLSVIFPHVSTWDERAAGFSKVYGRPSSATAPIYQLLFEQIKFYHFLEREGLAKIVRVRNDLNLTGLKLVLSLEGADVLQDPFDMELLSDLHVSALGLTWNYDNKFAASCLSRKDFGLTGYGAELVEQCNKFGVVVDLAHSSRRTLLDAAGITSEPMIVSHANAKRMMNHLRNLDDAEIEAVVKTGGVVGITAITSTLGKTPRIDDLVKHATYIGERFGWDHVALGTDFLGIEETPAGFEDVTKVARLGKLLGKHGDEVLWKNGLRVLSRALSKSSAKGRP